MAKSISKKKDTYESLRRKLAAREARALKERDKHAVKEVGEELAKRVLYMVDAGLVCGVGEPVRGKMCIEAAVSYAMGEEHGDEPSCVHVSVRGAKIHLNDEDWSNNKARAKGMRRIAVAQLGSKNIDHKLFVATLGNEFLNIIMTELKAYSKEIKDQNSTDFLIKLSKEPSFKKRRNMVNAFPKEGQENLLYGHGGYGILRSLSSAMAENPSAAKLISEMNAWTGMVAYGKERDVRLTRIADCIEKALVKCKSEGRKWLHLCKN